MSLRMRRRAPGIVLWLVLGLGAAMFILAFAFHSLVQDQNTKAHQIRFGLAAQGLAESGVNLAVDALRAELSDPFSGTIRAILDAPAGKLDPLPMPAGWAQQPELLGGDPAARLEVRVRLEEVRALGDPNNLARGFDPGEREATLVIVSTGWMRQARQSIEERRRIRIANLAFPVVSRFTLFVRSPEPTDEVAQGYNLYANDIAGAPDPTVPSSDNVLPIVCRNHVSGLGSADDLRTHGAIFLGGDRDLIFNLTSGGEHRFGQYFHFYNFLALDTSKPAAFLNDSPPPFFRQPRDFMGQSLRFSIKHAFYGYFTVDRHPTDPRDMNRDGILRRCVAARPNLRSSTLHLFGSALDPSPTRVYGPVYHSYPIFSAVTIDADGDGVRDGVVKMLPAAFEDEYGQLDTVDPFPSQVANVSTGQVIPLDIDTLHYSTLFGDHATYSRYASLLVEHEPYNTGVDYLQSRGEFPPREPALDPGGDYPNPGTNARIPSWKDGVTHFQGNLAAFDGSAFETKPIVSVKDEAEFLRRFLRPNGRIELGAIVRIRQGGLTLPERVQVADGGAVVCDGPIEFNTIETFDGQLFTLCSISGDIRGGFGGPCRVNLIALNGSLRDTPAHRPIDLTGTVAVQRLPAGAFPRGGQISFDPSADPSDARSRHHYRVYMADLASWWRS